MAVKIQVFPVEQDIWLGSEGWDYISYCQWAIGTDSHAYLTYIHVGILTDRNIQTLDVHSAYTSISPRSKAHTPHPAADSPPARAVVWLVTMTPSVTIDVTLTFLPFPQ